jgi:hypothetical protein
MRSLFATLFVALCALTAVLTAPGDVRAQAPSAKQEARERFDRGIKLLEESNNAGALAEFGRAYELVQSPLVLYNMGLVYATMGRAVDAVDAFDKVLAEPRDLGKDDIARAVETRAEQLRRVAVLELVTDAKDAVVEVDNVRFGKTPLARPLRVVGGTHVVTVVVPGFHPFHKEITVAGSETRKVTVELVALEQQLARLRVATRLPDAEVVVDGEKKGTTPLAAPLVVEPGLRRVELRRDGYKTAKAEVTAVAGAAAEVALEPEIDAIALATQGEVVNAEVSESAVTVSVDGGRGQELSGGLRLLPGRHVLRFERGGFVPAERAVLVQRGVTSTVRVFLEATAEHRVEVESAARTRRTWGWITAGVGVAVAAGGVAYLKINADNIDQAQKDYDQVVAETAPNSGRRCDPFSPNVTVAQCNADLTWQSDHLQSTKSLTKIGYVTVGAGAAMLVTGVVLVLTAPGARDAGPSSVRALTPVAAWEPGRGWVGLSGAF